ncbi:XRE family transcriptional regulator [Streptomyces sp. URMC 126]|uniref:XRE family transcriptional regulator n=1 Tax=Streptomyces sp. URMC 126 TaxID=3423401 RepID=UPI003F1B8648
MRLAELLADAMRRQHLSAETLAYATGIRIPRIRAFVEDGTEGPVRPTPEELTELAAALALPLYEVPKGSQGPCAVATADR